MALKLEQQLKEVGSKLETPPATKDALIKLLKVRIFLNCQIIALILYVSCEFGEEELLVCACFLR